jgi:hypothetical protein
MLQNPPPDLLSLPNELLAKICIYAVDEELSACGKEWLRAVRLTCKLLYAPATNELAKRFLTSPTVIMSSYSLHELVALCEHELIGPHVQEIVFYPCRMSNEYLGIIQAHTDSLATKGDFEGITKVQRHIGWYLTRLRDEIRLRESGDARMLLQQAFGALQPYQKPIKLTTTTRKLFNVLLTHSEWKDSKPHLEEFLSFAKNAYAHGGGSMAILTILEAVVAAGSHIHAFKVAMNSESIEPYCLSHAPAHALSRLERLEVDVGSSRIRNTDITLLSIISNAKGLVRVVYSSNPEHVKKSSSMVYYLYQQVTMLSS